MTVQALFFADGGLLALGANMFNLGVLPCFVAYPLIYRPLAGPLPSERRLAMATLIAAILGLQLGALGVVLQTTLSGISSLPLKTFLLLMLPIHAAIGVAEGLATVAVLVFLRRARPDLPGGEAASPADGTAPIRPLLAAVAVAALFTGGVACWFASTQPDGLEWSVARTAGSAELDAPPSGLHATLATLQKQFAWLPGYDLPAATEAATPPTDATWPDVNPARSMAGVVGGVVTLALVMAVGFGLRRRRPSS